MKIALVGKFNTENVGVHVEEAFIDMGHEVLRIDPQTNFLQFGFLGLRIRNMAKSFYNSFIDKIPSVRALKSKSMYKQLEGNQVDLTLVLHDFLNGIEVKTMKEITGSPVVIWFPDAISNFGRSLFFIAGYDFLFFKDKYVVGRLKNELALNAHYLPQCCNPKIHNKRNRGENIPDKYNCEITNAGNLYPSRAALLRHLTKYDFKMWGGKPSVWMNIPELNSMIMGVEVFNHEKVAAFTSAKIVLNNMHLAEVNGLNKRAFEIPACGGFQIISYNDAVDELFTIDKEIVAYYNLEDLISKIDYYLDPANEKERCAIVEAGYQRAIKDHTYENRLTSMLSTIFSES